MSDFPELIKQAANTFKNQCTAWTQIRAEGNNTRVRLQAPLIAQQFVGDVEFGKDPQGLLFYHQAEDFLVHYHKFNYYRSGWGSSVTILIDFFEDVDGSNLTLLARFLARVDTNIFQIPTNPSGNGKGMWSNFRAAVVPTAIIRAGSSTTLHLQFHALKKRVYFQSGASGSIKSEPGLLIFKDIDLLKDRVDGTPVVADLPARQADRILFHPRGNPGMVVALFLPDRPISVGSYVQLPTTTWKDLDVPATLTRFLNADGPDEDFSADDVDASTLEEAEAEA